MLLLVAAPLHHILECHLSKFRRTLDLFPYRRTSLHHFSCHSPTNIHICLHFLACIIPFHSYFQQTTPPHMYNRHHSTSFHTHFACFHTTLLHSKISKCRNKCHIPSKQTNKKNRFRPKINSHPTCSLLCFQAPVYALFIPENSILYTQSSEATSLSIFPISIIQCSRSLPLLCTLT